jgi:hypothetical protein
MLNVRYLAVVLPSRLEPYKAAAVSYLAKRLQWLITLVGRPCHLTLSCQTNALYAFPFLKSIFILCLIRE